VHFYTYYSTRDRNAERKLAIGNSGTFAFLLQEGN